MFGYLTEPIVWFICIVYLPYLTFRAAATDDGQHVHYAITWWVVTLFTVVQTMPILYTIISWVPFYYEMKLIVILLVMYTRASTLLHRRILQPVFARHIKSPHDLAKSLPINLQNQWDLHGMHEFGAKFVQNTPKNVLEYGFPVYRLVCAMLIQSATPRVERNAEWEAQEMGLASGFAKVAGAAASGVASGVSKVAKLGMSSIGQADSAGLLATAAATSVMKSSVEMGM